MKANIKTINEQKFKPFKLEITVESVEELQDLWNRFNLNDSRVYNTDMNGVPFNRIVMDDVWKLLNAELGKANVL